MIISTPENDKPYILEVLDHNHIKLEVFDTDRLTLKQVLVLNDMFEYFVSDKGFKNESY